MRCSRARADAGRAHRRDPKRRLGSPVDSEITWRSRGREAEREPESCGWRILEVMVKSGERSGAGKREGERRAPAQLALDLDLAAEALDQVLHDGQAQTRPAELS